MLTVTIIYIVGFLLTLVLTTYDEIREWDVKSPFIILGIFASMAWPLFLFLYLWEEIKLIVEKTKKYGKSKA